ncbi:hypothetical protein NP233_g2061 [Leucocoprinus birnbaumii]|uniref:Geranylgeranyl pyrophosphate synthetase n=1 Tax=Leucocoprinus birnbaumii TaxID=56174 RepID=A0AAD5VZM8_9AGAR|nr:hypothetical protein NP233_g2061 [Leucocoprinus birnbaumii]
MSSPGYPSHWRRQSLPSYRGLNTPVSPPSSKPFVSYVAKERSAPLEPSLPPDRRLNEGLNERLQTLEVPSLDDLDEVDDPEIKDCQFIGSYNWTKKTHPTIIVPGKWQELLAPPYTVQPDMGIHYIDQNSYRMPSANLLPLIVAVNQKQKNEGTTPFPWGTIDFVTDRNGLRKLLRWIIGGEVKDFRIDAQLAGEKTVLLSRWEKRTRENFNGRTYGFQFEKASTAAASGCKEGCGHHRIITYDFNGLKMVVRYEVDACMPQPRTRLARKSEASTLDSLADAMSNMNLTTTVAPFSSNTMPALNIINAGTNVPQAATIELTTIAVYRREKFNWDEAYPQLFLSQTSHHFLAVHNRGQFISVEKRKLVSDPEFEKIHKSMKPALKKLRKILEIIQQVAVKHGTGGRLTFVCSDGELAVYQRRSQTSCLPDEAMSCFDLKQD